MCIYTDEFKRTKQLFIFIISLKGFIMKNNTMVIAIMKFQWIQLCIRFEDADFYPEYCAQIDYLEERIAKEVLLENSYTPEACTIPPKPKVYTEEVPF